MIGFWFLSARLLLPVDGPTEETFYVLPLPLLTGRFSALHFFRLCSSVGLCITHGVCPWCIWGWVWRICFIVGFLHRLYHIIMHSKAAGRRDLDDKMHSVTRISIASLAVFLLSIVTQTMPLPKHWHNTTKHLSPHPLHVLFHTLFSSTQDYAA